MASSSSSLQLADGELILAVCHGRPVTAYDALSGHVVEEFPAPAALNTSRHGLAAAAPFVAASHVCPVTGAGSVLLLHWWSRAPARSIPLPEPVAPLVAAPRGSHLLAGGLSGRVHAVALPSGDVARSFRAHGGVGGGIPVSCLVLNDDGSLLVSGGYDGEVAVFALVTVLDVDVDVDVEDGDGDADFALYRVPAHAAPVSCVACGGRDAVVATASMDGTCKLWALNNGAHLRTLTLPCTAFSLTMDRCAARVFAGGADGRVHVASLKSTTATTTTSWNASGAAAIVGVGMANGGNNLVTCTEYGEVSVWDITSAGGALLAGAFRIGGAVTDVVVIKKSIVAAGAGDGDMVVRARDVGVGFRVWDDGEAWRRAGEVVRVEERLKESEVEKRRSVELVEMAVGGYKRCLRLMLREVTGGNGRRPNDVDGDGHVND